jgi:hypothetical protein
MAAGHKTASIPGKRGKILPPPTIALRACTFFPETIPRNTVMHKNQYLPFARDAVIFQQLEYYRGFIYAPNGS